MPAAPRRRGLGGGAAAAAGPSRAMSAKGSPAGKHAAALGRSASTPASPAEKMGRPQRHQLIVQDMVFALRLGTHDERVPLPPLPPPQAALSLLFANHSEYLAMGIWLR